MNIFELLSFDFQDFVTSPAGILIIIGILCLLVGIVIFLKEGKKKPETKDSVNTTSEVMESKEEKTPVVEEKVETPAPTVVAPTPVEEVKPVVEPINETTPIVVPSEGDGVKEVPVAPVAETINFDNSAPAVTPLTPAVEPLNQEPVSVVAPAAVTPVVESLDEPAPTVYGGASPEVSKAEILEEKPREIYGGANPLENTAPIPQIVNAQDAVAQVAPTPVAQPEVAPVVTPVAPTPVAQPEVAPVVTPVAPAPVVQPEVAPVVTPVAAPEEKKEEIEKLEF